MRIHDFFHRFEGESFTYDDLIFHPGFVDFSLEEVLLQSSLTRDLKLNVPLCSSPMDTVTESELAISLALQGGIGFIHYNMSPEEQRKQVERVKRFKNGFVSDPLTLPPHATIRDVVRIRESTGWSTIPITDDGKLVGMITKYDYSRFSEENLSQTIKERMIPKERLPFATYDELLVNGNFDCVKANERLLDSHAAALPVVDREGRLLHLITRSDLDKHQNYPKASTDRNQALLVGAAVETWAEKAQQRIEALEQFVDVILFDTSQGYTSYEIDLIRWTKRHFPHLQVIGGNVVTQEACLALIQAGADAIRIGMGSGSICTTQEVGGIGRGQATAVFQTAKVCLKEGVPIIADGGVTKSSDIVKTLSLGASTAMLGSLLACTLEAPGVTQIKDGIRMKEYRGMGSLKAMEKGSANRYGIEKSLIRVPEGVSGMVPSRGSVTEWVPCLLQGVKQGLHKLGARSIENLHHLVKDNQLYVEKRSEGAKREGAVHTLFEVNETSSLHEMVSPSKFFVSPLKNQMVKK